MTRALVVGGKGLIGSVVIRGLVELGVDVVCLEPKATPGRLAGTADAVEIVEGDVRDAAAMRELLAHRGFDVVLALQFLRSADLALELDVMVRGTWNVFESCLRTGTPRVVFPSSIRVYGPQWRHGEVALDEASPCLSTRRYGVYKRLAEIVAQDYNDAGGVEIRAARVPIVYGPGIREGGASMVLAPYRAANGLATVLPYRPETKLCVAHVEDVANVFVRLALADETRHRLYEIGGAVTSYGEIADLTRAALPGADISFEPAEEDPEAEFAWLADNTRLREELGCTHRDVRTGLTEFIETARGS